MKKLYKITPELQQIDHTGFACMTWSLCDHHGGEAAMTCGRSPHHTGKAWMTWSLCDHHGGKAAMTCGRSPHHPGKAWVTSKIILVMRG
jgi:hypothetical protein